MSCVPVVPADARNSPPDSIGKRPPAVVSKRRDFLAANRGKRFVTPGFVLLIHPRGDHDDAARFGVTVTKKIGNAVVRNRMKRRFRELARMSIPELGIAGADHILIGRAEGRTRNFASLADDLDKGLRHIGRKLGRDA